MKRRNFAQNLFLLMFMLVGLALLCVGIFSTVDRNKKMKTYETVQGGIVDYREKDGENGRVYSAVYAYTVDGYEYTFYDTVFTNKIPRIGERVEIMYDPSAPQNAFAKGAVTPSFIFIIMGGMFFAIPFFAFITSNVKSAGRRAEVLKGIFVGMIFAGLGYGLCFGLKQGISFATIFCFLFGSLGVFFMGYGVYSLFKPEKQSGNSLETQNNDYQQGNYYIPDEEIGQENFLTGQPGEYYGGNAEQQAYYDGKTGEQEYYGEKIEQTRNIVKKGVNIAAAIQRIVAGAVFAGGGGFMIKTIMNPEVEATGMSRLPAVLFLGIFVMLGLSQVIKGIVELLRK